MGIKQLLEWKAEVTTHGEDTSLGSFTAMELAKRYEFPKSESTLRKAMDRAAATGTPMRQLDKGDKEMKIMRDDPKGFNPKPRAMASYTPCLPTNSLEKEGPPPAAPAAAANKKKPKDGGGDTPRDRADKKGDQKKAESKKKDEPKA